MELILTVLVWGLQIGAKLAVAALLALLLTAFYKRKRQKTTFFRCFAAF